MKQLFYSALVGSLALAVSVQAADPNQAKKKAKSAPHAQKAQVKSAGPSHANMHANSNAMHAQKKTLNNPSVHKTASVHTNKMQNNGAAVHHANVNKTAVSTNVARNQNVNVNRVHHTNVNKSQNVNVAGVHNTSVNRNVNVNQQKNWNVNNQHNVNVNRHRNVAVVNSWHGSAYHAPQYSAFRNYRRVYHDRNWYVSRYPRIVIFGGGNYYWNNGYWYPAWGYSSGYNYGYDGPIYGYNNLDPQQVVVNVQAQLQQQGYYDGPVDGSLGPITRGALAAFQQDHGLAITSAIDQPTLATLGLS